MEEKIIKSLSGNLNSYIMPFLWTHGEDEAVIREYMDVIRKSNINEVCIECRPHPDFCGERWWQDMDIIMEEARVRGMRVWLLDDAHFPTGYANGAFTNADETKCKQYINFNTADIAGPLSRVSIDLNTFGRTAPVAGSYPGLEEMGIYGAKIRPFSDDKVISVIAYQIEEDNQLGIAVDLTGNINHSNNQLNWQVPEGYWRVFCVHSTRNGGGRTDYMNVIDQASVRVLIDTVYETHYKHYKDDFGKTFAGFFSDETAFGNTEGYQFNESIGKREMALPWCSEVPGLLMKKLGKNYLRLLPLLWQEHLDKNMTGEVRYAYMDCITSLVEKNFSGQIGSWCEEHGVEYIGHIVEDNNQHTRLGPSLGHFFRALGGQHMSGIDVIGGQVIPGGENNTRVGAATDGEFFHFALGKMASSDAHLDSKKKGRSMCEIFGAYGWGLGITDMKFLADHFMVRGVNRYVPHAFNMKAFPDIDCPPHFYAHGENPQYKHFGLLMLYIQRVCNLIDSGIHIAPAAVLYDAESSWSGNNIFNQKVFRELMENQIDFDIVPSDIFANKKYELGKSLKINQEEYRVFIISGTDYITDAVAEFIEQAQLSGFPVIFTEYLPKGCCNSKRTLNKKDFLCMAAKKLSVHLRNQGIFDISINPECNQLRYYRYRSQEEIVLLMNESPSKVYEGMITVPFTKKVFCYDAWKNEIIQLEYNRKENGTELFIHLEPKEMIILSETDDLREAEKKEIFKIGEEKVLDNWTVSICNAKEYPDFKEIITAEKLPDMASELPDFSGYIRYETVFRSFGQGKFTLHAEEIIDGADVWCNDQYVGCCIARPYQFDLSETITIKDGMNRLRIEVASTLERKTKAMGAKNGFMKDSPILRPYGINGKVYIHLA